MKNIYKIENQIKNLKMFEEFLKSNKNNIVFVCVGNSDVWYDSFGPIVGSLLININNFPYFVYGNMHTNIKLTNLNNYINWIKKKHFNKKIVVIDAALSKINRECIVFREGAIKCAYFNKESKPFGDFSILCPINENIKKIDNGFVNIINNSIIIKTLIVKYLA